MQPHRLRVPVIANLPIFPKFRISELPTFRASESRNSQLTQRSDGFSSEESARSQGWVWGLGTRGMIRAGFSLPLHGLDIIAAPTLGESVHLMAGSPRCAAVWAGPVPGMSQS